MNTFSASAQKDKCFVQVPDLYFSKYMGTVAFAIWYTKPTPAPVIRN